MFHIQIKLTSELLLSTKVLERRSFRFLHSHWIFNMPSQVDFSIKNYNFKLKIAARPPRTHNFSNFEEDRNKIFTKIKQTKVLKNRWIKLHTFLHTFWLVFFYKTRFEYNFQIIINKLFILRRKTVPKHFFYGLNYRQVSVFRLHHFPRWFFGLKGIFNKNWVIFDVRQLTALKIEIGIL